MKDEQLKENLKTLQDRLIEIHDRFKQFHIKTKNSQYIPIETLEGVLDEYSEYEKLLYDFHSDLKKNKKLYPKYQETLVLIDALVFESTKLIKEIEVNYTMLNPNYNKYQC